MDRFSPFCSSLFPWNTRCTVYSLVLPSWILLGFGKACFTSAPMRVVFFTKVQTLLFKSLTSMASLQGFSAPQAFQEWAVINSEWIGNLIQSSYDLTRAMGFINVTTEIVKPRLREGGQAIISSCELVAYYLWNIWSRSVVWWSLCVMGG